MSYRSDVVLVIHRRYYDDLLDLTGVETLLDDADQKHEDGDALLYYWDCSKWYGDAEDSLQTFLSADVPEDEYYFARIGEDLEDTDVRGNWWDNPFECHVVRSIDYNTPHSEEDVEDDIDPVWLKGKNTNPAATHCASCGEELNDPYPNNPNMKHCRSCEP